MSMKILYDKSAEEALRMAETDPASGLSDAEAARRLEAFGKNRLAEGKRETFFQMFLSQFKDFLVIILIVAAVVSFFLGDVTEGVVIAAIVILNALLGAFQENRASNALAALKSLSSPSAKVLRGGGVKKVASEDVAPGDIIIVEAGDYIPADLRIIESVNLKIEESALTGESVPTEKDAAVVLAEGAPLGDRVNMAYMGTVATYGRGKGLVSATGMETEMGSIAKMLESGGEGLTPLQVKLDAFGKVLGIACLAICAVIFAIGLLRGDGLAETFMIAVSLAVAAIPEGLTVIVTVILALGMQRMVRINAIVKKLSAVEALGSTTVICSDKTGTLTQNKMTVTRVFGGAEFYDVSGTGYSPEGRITAKDGSDAANPALDKLFEGAANCVDAVFNKAESAIIGDPTEGALLVAAAKYSGAVSVMNRVGELPFDSGRKLMSVACDAGNIVPVAGSGRIQYTKGAPDETLRRCANICEGGAVRPITESDRAAISAANDEMAGSALRVLAVGFKYLEDGEPLGEDNLTFAGLLGMIDPPREEVKSAIATCRAAGIKVRMITGDHKATAAAIARQIGIEGYDSAMDGKDIDRASDAELTAAIQTTGVFARVSPEHKVRLVEAVRAGGDVVAMTGDGVNDAPSLNKADIGVAMGITGTDVSKEAADMILTDDNFATIVNAVEEGRTIYNNIVKVVGYLLSCNIGEILLIFVAMIAGLPVPLDAIQLLSINLITDALPAFALGMEPRDPDVMRRKPRDPALPIVDRPLLALVLAQSAFLAAACLGSYMYGHFVVKDEGIARSMCFVTIVCEELLRAYSSRALNKPFFLINPATNRFLIISVLASLAVLAVIAYVPAVQGIFDMVTLAPGLLGISVALAFAALLGDELVKAVYWSVKKKEA
jgi:Ca2+-transporting ATPase